MNISEKTWTAYTRQLARLNEKAGQLLADYIAAHGTGDAEALINYAYALVTKYGEGSAALAAQMYDELAALQNVHVPPAEPAPTAQYGEVAKMVRATRESPPQMQRGVSRLVKRAGADTTLKNAQRDGAEFAWVPHGDSCAFCLTLASRGWQRASQAAIRGGHAEHIHASCDCEYAVRFDGRTGVAGYDPEAYLAQYNAAGGDINRMRRVNYAANKERINAQKRAAYAARKAREQAQTGLQDVLAEYLDNAQPGMGTVTYEDGYRISHHGEEIKTAQWLHENLGGDIVLLQENLGGEKKPDYLWKQKQWELKSVSTEKAADSAVRGALKQIEKIPGGIIVDCGDNVKSCADLQEIVASRMQRSCYFDTDVVIIKDGKLVQVLRYRKK